MKPFLNLDYGDLNPQCLIQENKDGNLNFIIF